MKTSRLLATALACAFALPAVAAQFDFYKLNQPNNSSLDFLPNSSFGCTGNDLCSSDVDGNMFGGSLSYTTGGLTATATGTFNGNTASVVQDSTAGWSATNGAGLGIYHLTRTNSDDNITTGEKLIIAFDRIVQLTNVGLRSEGHNFNSWDSGATFLFDNVSTLLPQGVGSISPINLIGQVFTFEFGGTKGDQFYLSSLTAFAVPEPESLVLVLAALGAMGLTMQRRGFLAK